MDMTLGEPQVLLNDSQLQDLWYILVDCSTYPTRERLSYEDVCQACAHCADVFGLGIQPYFQANVFLALPRDEMGRINCASLFGYVMRRNAMLQMRRHLRAYAAGGSSSLTVQELKKVVCDMIPEMESLTDLASPEESNLYSQFVAARFKFFLGGKRRMRIGQFLLSFALADFLELKLPPEEVQPSNLMSMAAFTETRMHFDALRSTSAPWLTLPEFSRYNNGTLTLLCVQRLFEVHGQAATAEEAESTVLCLSFAAFTEFLTAWSHKHLLSSCRYLFKLLDLGSNGYLTQEDLYAFLKAMHQAWLSFGQPAEPTPADLLTELIDIIGPENPKRITLEDLMACGMAGTVIGMLLDVQLFWEYDSREELLLSTAQVD